MPRKHNPDNFKAVLTRAERGTFAKRLYHLKNTPSARCASSLPIRMDNGEARIRGLAVQHFALRGPCKGGIRYHQDVDEDEVKRAGGVDDDEVRCRISIPLRRGWRAAFRGGPAPVERGELERLTRRRFMAIMPIIGPERDIPAPDVNTTPEIRWADSDIIFHAEGYAVPGVVTGKPIEVGGFQLGPAARPRAAA